jgi:LmbE family N-acetylglucosaminyl deacetylase
MRVLWIFAHQDDEIAAAPRMLEQLRRGESVRCVFLCGRERRDAESRAALASLGITDVTFLAFPDGRVVEHLGEIAIDGEADEVGCLAYEGGHQDHDAAHLFAVAFARARGIDAYEVPLYNGAGFPFRVMHPIGDGWTCKSIALRDAWRTIALVRFHKSQRRTWLGLLPEAFVKLVLLRRAYARRVERMVEIERPFYERRFKFPRERFRAAAAEFLARHFADAPPSPGEGSRRR